MSEPEPSIHVTRWGTAGPRVLLIHGSAQGSSVGGDRHFARQQGLAQQGWQVIVPDRPGHGRSPAPGRPDDAALDGEWVAGLLGDGAHLVGHSFGGCVALAAAARRPEAVLSLTLIEPGMQPLAISQAAVRGFVLQLLLTRWWPMSARRRVERFARLLHIPPEIRGGRSDAECRRMAHALAALRVPAKRTLAQGLATLKAARIPLLVVSGGWSPAIEATAAEVSRLGAGRHSLIAAPHHFPHLVSEAFNQQLAGFMTAAAPHRLDRATSA